MEKVIKVIDLLDMIAKGEKTPKRIRYAGYIFEKSDDYRYYTFFDEENFQTNHLMEYVRCSDMNDEVEILDEEEQEEIDIQKINKEDLIIIQELETTGENYLHSTPIINRKIMDIINNLIDEVKKLDNKLKEK